MRDRPVIDALQAVVELNPRWDFGKCFDRIRLDGKPWNHKRVRRVYCGLGLNLPRRTKRRLPTRPRRPLVAPDRLNGVWAVDFMHDTLYCGRRFRTFNVIDEANRARDSTPVVNPGSPPMPAAFGVSAPIRR